MRLSPASSTLALVLHDVTRLSGAVVLHSQQVPIENTEVFPAVALDPVQGRAVGLIDEVVVQRQKFRPARTSPSRGRAKNFLVGATRPS